MLIRRATAADAAVIADVHNASRAGAGDAIPPAVHTEEETRRFVADVVLREREAYLALDEGVAVGVLVLDGDDLDWLYVAPDAQGRGVGGALVEHAKALRPGGLALWAFQSNRPARRFYERHGFVEVRCTEGANEEGAPDVRCVWGRHPEGLA